jgi:Raf kinase inhibitor-like YbhB/YbcL family protein
MTLNIEAADTKLVAHKQGFGTASEIEVRSPEFTAGEWLPRKFTQEGANVSPLIIWKQIPEATKELVLICEDPNAPIPEPFVHWLIYGISPTRTSLPGDIRADSPPEVLQGAKQGKNSKGKIGYIGPFPPIGSGPHFYHFQLFAIGKELNLPAGVERHELVKKMSGNILGQGTFIGIYERFGNLG